jgi:thiol:disulfide interchange protein
MTRSLLCVAALVWSTLALAAPTTTVRTPQVQAELVAHAPEGVAPGKPMWLGLHIRHQPHWHTYWKNPGDSGLPTTLEWKLPAGVTAGEIQWPTPKKLPIGPLLNYGFEGSLLLPVAVTIPAGFNAASLEVQLKAEWLVCKDVCIPESGEFALSLPAQSATAGHKALFDAAQAAMPQRLAAAQGSARVEGQELVLQLSGLPSAWTGRELDFLPETPGVISNAAKPAASWQGSTWSARVALDPQRSESPRLMPAVFTTAGEAAGVHVTLSVSTPWPATIAAPALPALGGAAQSVGAAPMPPAAAALAPLLGAMLLALVGGSLLNLMPCVFPVLSLKVFSFAAKAHDRRALLASGLAYTAGVMATFLALAVLMLVLRAGGEQLGWGFQLQSPFIVAALAALFCLIALNLAGGFEVRWLMPDAVGTVRARHPLVDHGLTGVLAVVVAAPCTAPFMGASLGVALTLPAAQALLIFAALGLGMALPYLVASAWPGFARALPRPGAWMNHFKVLMAFPMWATAIWLVWVLGQQVGIDGAATLLATLLALSWLAWAWGSTSLEGMGAWGRRSLNTVALITLAATLAWALPTWSGAARPQASLEEGWQPWSAARVAELTGAGRPVFVDFTAAWCVTCQFNKRTTLSHDEVKAAFAQKQVALLRADWTSRDANISAELTRLGRSGVPVYALYAPGLAAPKLLSEILSVQEVRDALAALPR